MKSCLTYVRRSYQGFVMEKTTLVYKETKKLGVFLTILLKVYILHILYRKCSVICNFNLFDSMNQKVYIQYYTL